MNHNDREMLAVFAVVGVFVGIMLLISLAIHAVLCWYISGCFKRIPEQYRLQQPNMVWLLMIPCFNLVWSFFVYPQLADSFSAYFRAQGRPDVDCGRSLAMAYCILLCTTVIPYLGALTGTAALVVLIIFLVKATELKNQIPVAAATMLPDNGPNLTSQ